MRRLAYLRFDGPRDTRVALVRCSGDDLPKVLAAAKAVRGYELTEYATFRAAGSIRPVDVPNFPEELIYEAADFLRACGAAAEAAGRPPGSTAGKTRALPPDSPA